ncbi:hypothetical protein O181_094764 [Austropuccinia psidii MF-1]|uniref:Uncharacterized protein n=1 Tax=Austropuccinia psidii MF-1 TaxID=1389203 RepID=A0A9Q3PB40_9BASI|nr:hypothetical protein [Austropuccinia psidii MF-1]
MFLHIKLLFLAFLIIIIPSTRLGASSKPSSSSQKGYRHDYGRSQSVTEGQGDDTSTRSLCEHIQSHPKGLKQCHSAQRVPDPCRSVEKIHELLPDREKTSGPYQHFQVTQWMAYINGKGKNDSFNRKMEETQLSTTQASSKNSPNSQKEQFQHEEEAKSSEKGQREGTSHKTIQPGIQNPKDLKGFHGKCISNGQNYDGIT